MKTSVRTLIVMLVALDAAMPPLPMALACGPAAAMACCCTKSKAQPACPRSHSCEMTERSVDPANVLPQSGVHVSRALLAERMSCGPKAPLSGDGLAACAPFAYSALDSPIPKRYLRIRALRL